MFRNYSEKNLESLSTDELAMFNSILDLEDQPLYDFIFKNEPLNNPQQEDFILKNLKNFIDN
ncbi:flavinator of succinate dehydrogenase [SAR86 cluster bacterium SAR86E]|uniref:FAD assembly factor SdhE n=1 Tax=SAR86 cluster bacterium SAR86E TaxID=1208365 RepID=K6GHN8_9GAMM|nr:flavinator of succinate dehydrogenase [SAR86 cluster bacterium SAR86E]